MKISDSSLQLQGRHSSSQFTQLRESLIIQASQRKPESSSLPGKAEEKLADQVNISPLAQRRNIDNVSGKLIADDIISSEPLKIMLLKALFRRYFGKEMKLPDQEAFQQKQVGMSDVAAVSSQPSATDTAGWSAVYERSTAYTESESMQFTTRGIVRTEDGRESNIDVQLNMSREFYAEQYERITLADALKDPLVINYSGTAIELADTSFSFDIDADGTSDQIASLVSGSGFLVLDGNNDGIINDGSELFGALSGAGFSELAACDEDNNGWIDENDSVYDRLKIWVKDENGNDQLFALGEKGVGALCLENIPTRFSLKNEENELLGEVRSTGIFLHEDGSGETIQQIDLVA